MSNLDYCSIDDVKSVLPDVLSTDSLTNQVIEKAINRGAIRVNIQIKHLYSTPLSVPIPEEVKEATVNYSIYFLLMTAFSTQQFTKEAKEYRDEFMKIADDSIKRLVEAKYRESQLANIEAKNSKSSIIYVDTEDNQEMTFLNDFRNGILGNRFL